MYGAKPDTENRWWWQFHCSFSSNLLTKFSILLCTCICSGFQWEGREGGKEEEW